jgi:hypothetical protein
MFTDLPQEVQDIINHYFNLSIGGKSIKTPYYRNKTRTRGGLRVLVGKGSPNEIEDEVKIYAKLRGVDLTQLTENDMRDFMRSEGIGIDCSGYVCHIVSTWIKSHNGGSLHKLIKVPPMSFIKRIIFASRTIENISSEVLTSELNCTKVEISDVHVGDLIRLKGIKQGHHLAIIVKVDKKDDVVTMITYTHSAERYSPNDGVRVGQIEIVDQNLPLKDQRWLELDENGECWTLQGYLNQLDDNGLRRLKFHESMHV